MTDYVDHKVRMTFDMRHKLRVRAAEEGRTMNAVMLDALAARLEEPVRPAPAPPADFPQGQLITRFIAERCEVRPDAEVPTRALSDAFRAYASGEGEPQALPASVHSPVFSRLLRAACPTVTGARRRRDGRLTYLYQGIRLRASVISP